MQQFVLVMPAKTILYSEQSLIQEKHLLFQMQLIVKNLLLTHQLEKKNLSNQEIQIKLILFLSLGLNTEKESTYWLESFLKFLLNLKMFISLLEVTVKEWVIYNN